MATVYKIFRQMVLPFPVAEAFAFFEDASNLQTITPDFLGFRILTPLPIQMKKDAVIDYRIRLFGFPVRWRTIISEYDPPHSFVDTQVKGPYRQWIHRHSFRAVDEGTEMTDVVHYQMPFGWIGQFARRLFVRRTLESTFDYRNEKIVSAMNEFFKKRSVPG